MGSNGVEGEALSNPSEASASLSTWKAEKPTARARLKSAANWIAEHELWWLAVPVTLMLFFGRVPIRVISASLWLIPIPWVCRRVAKGYLTVHTPMDLPIVILLGMALVGLYPSVDPSMSMPVLYKMIVEFALFYGLVNSFHSESRIRATVAVLLLAGTGASLLGLLGTGGMSPDFLALLGSRRDFVLQLVRRLNEAGFNGNIVGGTLAMIFPLYLLLFLFDSKGPSAGSGRSLWKLFLGLSLPLVGGTLLLTQSRGAIVGVVLALLAVGVWRSRWVLASLPVLVAGILWTVGHFGTQQVAEFLLVTNTTVTAAGRSELWQRAIYMMQDFPYTGIGLGTFSKVAPVLYPFFLIGPDTKVPHVHNLVLQAGVDLGVPGLVAMIGLLTVFFIIALQTVRLARNTSLKPLSVGLLCGFIVYLIHGLVDHVTFSTKPGIVIWAIMGLIVAIYRRHRERDLAR
ncbi:MAG: O-antigen ligase family protein [Anaerolineales bacterium]|nr:O-antigen ligase family protein [Anaerolineales bacterium]